jgi:Predicted phosphatases
MYKFAAFDVDGTLLDTLEGIGLAANAALGEMGFPQWPISEYQTATGHGPFRLAQAVLPKEVCGNTEIIDDFLRRYRVNYNRDCLQTTWPFPGMVSALEALRERNMKLAVLSNKPHEYVEPLIARFFPGVFDIVLGFRAGIKPKPAPDELNTLMEQFEVSAEQSAYVGDMIIDLETAINAKCRPVGVLWGFSGEVLKTYDGEGMVLVETADEMKRVLLQEG